MSYESYDITDPDHPSELSIWQRVQGKPVLCYTILSLKEQDYFRSHSQRSASIKDNDIPNQSTARLVALEEEDDYLFLFLLIADSG